MVIIFILHNLERGLKGKYNFLNFNYWYFEIRKKTENDPEDRKYSKRSKQTIENPRTIINDALSNLPRSSTHLIASKENLTQQISRVRRRQNGLSKSNPKNRMEMSIPEELRKTNSGSDFVPFDSGENDPDRLIILAINENLIVVLLFTINVLVNGRNIPVLYAFLADKTEKIYTRLFEFIKSRVNNEPENLFCDFEKGVLNSIEKCYKRTNISGCWFRLVSNLYKHVQSNGLVTAYKSRTDNRFRKCFKYLKFLHLIPPQDFYIGKQLDNDASKRAVPLYPIKYWNVHKRILKDLPRTKNNLRLGTNL
ncbi:hypothetical protein BpHYR1_052021 [Brachionus plicatilis]|uniref:Uncharacterized protein n=1 Tax=Brachionus plicatilis TaxID=10195 RepID=A0A3M7PF16_BRAPC|nr:hypothetical protein BpHYR1_052021 [Brachionus plicatilis]